MRELDIYSDTVLVHSEDDKLAWCVDSRHLPKDPDVEIPAIRHLTVSSEEESVKTDETEYFEVLDFEVFSFVCLHGFFF